MQRTKQTSIFTYWHAKNFAQLSFASGSKLPDADAPCDQLVAAIASTDLRP
jgi:hypothetical protein